MEQDDMTETVVSLSDNDQSGSTRTPATSINGEELAPVSVGSPNSQGTSSDRIHLAQGAGASGFVGKLSEISWLRRAREHMLQNVTCNWGQLDSQAHE